MARYLLLVMLVGVSVWMMEAKALPASKRRPSSLSGMRSLFSSFSQDDEMMPTVPAMMMMPSIVYYHVVSPYHSPFQLPMGKSMFGSWASRFAVESSEEEEVEEEEEAEESKKIEEISKSDKEEEEEETPKLVEESNKISIPEEEEEEETQTENEQVTEMVTEETKSFDGNEDQVPTTTEIPNTDPPISAQTTDEENSTTTTEIQQAEEEGEVEDKLVIKPSDNSTVKIPSRPSSTTYVCKFGKCQHTMEAKKLLEQEIEAELWAKL